MMEATVEIGEPQAGELSLLFSLARTTFADVPGWSDDRVLEVLEEDLVFVAREQSQAAGYVALRHDRGHQAVIVDQLFVAPGHEQRGVGHRLLAHAEGWAISERAQALRHRGRGTQLARAQLLPAGGLRAHRPRAARARPAAAPRLIWSEVCQPGTAEKARCLRAFVFGGGSAAAVVDVCVTADMRGSGPHDRVCEMRSGAAL